MHVEGSREGIVVDAPELVCAGGEVRRYAGVEEGSEVGVLAVSEEEEEILI